MLGKIAKYSRKRVYFLNKSCIIQKKVLFLQSISKISLIRNTIKIVSSDNLNKLAMYQTIGRFYNTCQRYEY